MFKETFPNRFTVLLQEFRLKLQANIREDTGGEQYDNVSALVLLTSIVSCVIIILYILFKLSLHLIPFVFVGISHSLYHSSLLLSCIMLQPEPFFLTLALYDANEGRKLTENVYLESNSETVYRMIPEELLSANDLSSGQAKLTTPKLYVKNERWLSKPGKVSYFYCQSN